MPAPTANPTSRRFVLALASLLCSLLCATSVFPLAHAQPGSQPLKIGIIGTGRIGGALARDWVKAGHEVMISSDHPENLRALAAQLGPRAHVGTPREAAAFGTVILVSVPYKAMAELGATVSKQLAGKVILDTSNPSERRDGAMAAAAQAKGAGIATAEYLHNRRVVRAFNCIPARTLATESNRKPARIAIPIGGDDPRAIRVAERLIRETGFDPVVVGSLAQTRRFDLGQPLAHGDLTAAQLTELMQRP
ncbi:MAG: NADPH-dependent F420 reductase [Steroidobacteraceae bacterium]